MSGHFLEAEYLRSNPDVATAVAAGSFPSGWAHYTRFGFAEGRPGVPESVREAVDSVMGADAPAPPVHLIERVHGTPDPVTFDKVGRIVALDLFNAVNGRLPERRPLSLLDFGCGCGRVTRFLGPLFPGAHISGSDIDAEAVGWCRDHCPGLSFYENGESPPLANGTGAFDLVVAVSVFTHLPEKQQFEWLEELRRVTRPDGLLVLTFAGDHLIRPHLSKDQEGELDRKGFHYGTYGATSGLPEYYQSSWHSLGYIQRAWGRYFRILGHAKNGINLHQDWVLCQPK